MDANPLCMFSSLTNLGTEVLLPVRAAVAQRYIELHEVIPDDLTDWQPCILVEMIDALDMCDAEAVEVLLILLAHHRSSEAVLLLEHLRAAFDRSNEELQQFLEIATAEALAWQGLSYVREIGKKPVIQSAKGPVTTRH